MQDHGNSQNGRAQNQSGAQERSLLPDAAPNTPSTEPNRPIETLRDGNLKASIWANQGENGTSYQTTFARVWRDDQGRWHDSQSYSGTDMLRLGELSRTAYHRTNALRQEHSQQQGQEQSQEAQNRKAFVQQRQQSAPDPSKNRER